MATDDRLEPRERLAQFMRLRIRALPAQLGYSVVDDTVVAPHVAASLARFRALVQKRFGERLQRLVLFGSQARGEADDQSDVDVLVVIDDLSPEERREVIDIAYDADAVDREHWAGISPLAWSTERFENMRARELLLVADIEAEGIPL